MAVSADGARLVAASRGGRLRLIDSSSGAVVRASGPVGAADRPLATLGSFGDGFVAVWAPAEAGQSPGVVVRATFDGAGEAPEGEQAMGAAVAVAATRTGLVSIDAQGCVHGDGGAVLCLQGEAPMVDVTASEDGRFVVAMTRERARLLEMAPQPRELARPRLARGLQRARFRAGSADVAFLDEEGRILVVDATSTTEKLDVELGLPQASQLAWLPGGGFAVGTRDGAVRVVGPDGAWRWDALASRSAVTALEPSPDGAFLAVAAALGGLSVLDLATGARLNSFPDLWESMVALAWTPDGGRLIAADNLGSLHSLAIESPDPRATWTRTGAGSNLRVCRESGEVRPVVPFPDAESAWAPAAACAPTTGSALARNPGVDPGILERWRAVGD
jgi:WD40 repeat protein